MSEFSDFQWRLRDALTLLWEENRGSVAAWIDTGMWYPRLKGMRLEILDALHILEERGYPEIAEMLDDRLYVLGLSRDDLLTGEEGPPEQAADENAPENLGPDSSAPDNSGAADADSDGRDEDDRDDPGPFRSSPAR